MDIKGLLFMLGDFSNVYYYEESEIYPIHTMENLGEFEINTLDNDLYVGGISYDSNFDKEQPWFKNNNGTLTSLSEAEVTGIITEDKDNIVSLYHKVEQDYKQHLNNCEEIRTLLLTNAVVEEEGDLELDEFDTIIYQDVNVSALAEVLAEVTVSDIQSHLRSVSSPSWDVVLHDEMHYLIER